MAASRPTRRYAGTPKAPSSYAPHPAEPEDAIMEDFHSDKESSSASPLLESSERPAASSDFFQDYHPSYNTEPKARGRINTSSSKASVSTPMVSSSDHHLDDSGATVQAIGQTQEELDADYLSIREPGDCNTINPTMSLQGQYPNAPVRTRGLSFDSMRDSERDFSASQAKPSQCSHNDNSHVKKFQGPEREDMESDMWVDMEQTRSMLDTMSQNLAEEKQGHAKAASLLQESETRCGNIETRLLARNESIRNMETQLRENEIKLRQTERKLQQTQSTLRQTESSLEETDKKRKQYYRRMIELTDTSRNALDDKTIESAMQDLRYQIRNWAMTQQWMLLRPEPSPKRIEKYKFLSKVSKDAQRNATSVTTTKQLVEAYIWRTLRREVMGRDNISAEARGNEFADRWADVVDDLYRGSRDFDLARARLWREWRITSTLLLNAITTVDGTLEKNTQEACNTLLQTLRPIATGSLDDSVMLEIFRCAVKLDFMLRRQKAVYEITPLEDFCDPRSDLEFSSNTMKIVDEEMEYQAKGTPPLIDMILRPGISKHGNEEGENYDQELHILKADVVLCRRAVQPNDSRPASRSSTHSQTFDSTHRSPQDERYQVEPPNSQISAAESREELLYSVALAMPTTATSSATASDEMQSEDHKAYGSPQGARDMGHLSERTLRKSDKTGKSKNKCLPGSQSSRSHDVSLMKKVSAMGSAVGSSLGF